MRNLSNEKPTAKASNSQSSTETSLFEGHANSPFASRCNMAWMLIVIAPDHQNEIIRNARRTGDLKTGSGG
jgi:hypothetical protein